MNIANPPLSLSYILCEEIFKFWKIINLIFVIKLKTEALAKLDTLLKFNLIILHCIKMSENFWNKKLNLSVISPLLHQNAQLGIARRKFSGRWKKN